MLHGRMGRYPLQRSVGMIHLSLCMCLARGRMLGCRRTAANFKCDGGHELGVMCICAIERRVAILERAVSQGLGG